MKNRFPWISRGRLSVPMFFPVALSAGGTGRLSNVAAIPSAFPSLGSLLSPSGKTCLPRRMEIPTQGFLGLHHAGSFRSFFPPLPVDLSSPSPLIGGKTWWARKDKNSQKSNAHFSSFFPSFLRGLGEIRGPPGRLEFFPPFPLLWAAKKQFLMV